MIAIKLIRCPQDIAINSLMLLGKTVTKQVKKNGYFTVGVLLQFWLKYLPIAPLPPSREGKDAFVTRSDEGGTRSTGLSPRWRERAGREKASLLRHHEGDLLCHEGAMEQFPTESPPETVVA